MMFFSLPSGLNLVNKAAVDHVSYKSSLDTSDLQVNPVLAVESLGPVLGLGNGSSAVAVETSSRTSETDGNVDGGEVGLLGGRLGGRLGGLGGLRRVLAEALKGKVSNAFSQGGIGEW
jgi:hypothetical protein